MSSYIWWVPPGHLPVKRISPIIGAVRERSYYREENPHFFWLWAPYAQLSSASLHAILMFLRLFCRVSGLCAFLYSYGCYRLCVAPHSPDHTIAAAFRRNSYGCLPVILDARCRFSIFSFPTRAPPTCTWRVLDHQMHFFGSSLRHSAPIFSQIRGNYLAMLVFFKLF